MPMIRNAQRKILLGLAAALPLGMLPAGAQTGSNQQVIIVEAATNAVPPRDTVPTNILVWSIKQQQTTASPGEEKVHFTFSLTNVSAGELTIYATAASCDCTVAKLPMTPWKLPPGGGGQINVTMDLRGKQGVITKEVTVFTSKGNSLLRVGAVILEAAAMNDRLNNQKISAANRQAVFKNDCARCHAEPTAGKTGGALYAAVCAVCHDSPRRASAVPDLRALKEPTSLKFWRNWITDGKPGTMMPAFAQPPGGPLTKKQIDSLAEYLEKNFRPKKSAGK
jgi:mono/diheme cytochrome c family protein